MGLPTQKKGSPRRALIGMAIMGGLVIALNSGVTQFVAWRLTVECPGARIAVHVPSPDTIWSWVSSGQCEIGLVRPLSGYGGVISETFLTVDAVCALPRRHVLTHKRTITVHDLASQPLIAGAPGIFQQAIEETFLQASIEPHFALMAQYTAARCGLVAEGLGLAIVDPVPARELTGLAIVLRPFRPRLAIETMLIRRGGTAAKHPCGALH